MPSSSSAQLLVENVSFSHGPTLILDRVSVTVGPGDRIGVIGPNGSGKSTLLGVMAGRLVPSTGRVIVVPNEASVGLVTQQLDDLPGETVADLAARRSGLSEVTAEFEAATTALADDASDAAADRYDRALTRWLAADPDGFERRLTSGLAGVGLADLDVDRPASALSGGQRSKLNLATVELSVHDILLLDEPTNDLDTEGLATLETMVVERAGGVVLVSHDRAFLAATITSVLELDAHSRTATHYHGGYGAWQTERQRAKDREAENYQNYVKARDTIAERIDRTQRWSTAGAARARRATRAEEPDRTIRAGKIRAAEELGAKATQAARALDRLEVVDKPFEPWVLRLRFAEAERSSERVAALVAAVISPADDADFSLGPIEVEIGWGDRVLITGANGSGKTTLLRALLGERPLVSGTHHLSSSARIGRLDQHRQPFANAPTLLDGFRDATGVSEPEARSQLAKLGLGVDHIARPADELSPGEQTRAVLGLFALTGVNLLVLDEPTNHLDLEAIEELELALDQFGGTLLLVTHDRRLIDTMTDSTRGITHHLSLD